MIEGGIGANVIPDSCTIVAGRRIVPGEVAQDVYDELAELAREACPLPTHIESALPPQPDGTCASDAFYLPPDAALVQHLAAWAQTAPAVAPFGTNALRYHEFAREKAVFGPGSIDDAHKATECVAIADLARLATVFTSWLDPAAPGRSR
jgi:acetylornithine deacetylase/succinyl-diaminopimelate desuccinylase-like protein